MKVLLKVKFTREKSHYFLKSYQCVLLCIIYSLRMPISVNAQEREIKFKHLNIDDGLSQNSITCMIRDDKGFMWLGTQDCLNKYDGYEFKIYKKDPSDTNSISDNYILCMIKDPNGFIWIGTEDGLNKFDPEKEQFIHYRHDPHNQQSLSNDHIQVLYISPMEPGILWIGTESGLNKLDIENDTIYHYMGGNTNDNTIIHGNIRAIHASTAQTGILWIGTVEGMFQMNISTEELTPYLHDLKDSNSLCHNRVQVIYESPMEHGILWIGTQNGLDRFEIKKRLFTHYYQEDNPSGLNNNHIRAVYESPREPGILWIGTFGGGINCLNKKEKTFNYYISESSNPYCISDNFILNFYEDSSGVFWVGTEGGGINKYEYMEKKFFLHQNNPDYSNSLVSNHVRSMCQSRIEPDCLWIGTYGGLDYYDRNKKTFTHYKYKSNDPYSLSSNLVRVVYEDSKGELWIGTYNEGLNRYDRLKKQFVHFKHDPDNPWSISHNYIRSIYEDREGTLWIATVGGGLNKFDRKNERFIHYQYDPSVSNCISSNRVYSIYEDRDGIIWIGTAEGLNRYDRDQEIFKCYKHVPGESNSLGNNMIISIYEDRSGTLWFGTWGGGINRFDTISERFYRFTEKDGLANDVVYGILEDDHGNLWLSTNHGLCKFNPKTVTSRNYDVRDGIQGNEFNSGAYFKNNNGVMFFGGINGLTVFHPDSIKDNPIIPSIVLADFQIFNKPVPIIATGNKMILSKSITYTDEISLSYKDNIISFEYAALNYVSPDKNKYAYIMEGLEKEWNYVKDRRFVTYTTLPPGDYVFKVKGSNNDGVWNEEGVSLKINITPPFWKTTWFQIFGIAIILLMTVVVFRIRTHAIRERSRELESHVEERTVELKTANQMLNKQVTIRKRMESDAQRRAKQASLIYMIGQRVSSELGLQTLFNEIVDSVRDAFDYYSVALFMVDKKAKYLILQAINGENAKIVPPGSKLKLGEGITGNAAVNGKTKISRDIRKDPDYVCFGEEKTRSEFAVPIRLKEEIIGVLDVQCDRLNAFNKTDVTAMETLSTQIATAIRNAQLYETSQKEIAERKRAEKEIEKRQKYLESVLYNAPDAIVTLDPSNNIVEWNTGAENIFKYTRDEVMGKNIDELVTNKEFFDEARIFSKQALSGKRVVPKETIRFNKNGDPINVILAGSPIQINNKLHGLVVVYTDISDRKKAEENLKQTMQDLESINSELQDFAHIVSHDLKAPLRGVSQLADWITKDNQEKLDDASKENLNLLQGRVKRMDNLIDGILQYSRAGRTQEQKTEVDLNVIVRNIIEDLAPPKHIEVEIENALPVIHAEEVKIRQVFQNLISNAIKYMDKPKGKVHVGSAEKSGHWEFHISDNGPGIDKKYHETIFKIFQTLEARDNRESTGVGLSVVKKIVEQNGGKIWVESEAGEGSRFIFKFPQKGV